MALIPKALGAERRVALARRAPSRRALRMAWPIVPAYVALFLFFIAPARDAYPAALAALVAFIGIQLVCPRCRFDPDNLFCPSNLAQGLFTLQLVVQPIVALYFGFSLSTLPWLPSAFAINIAILLQTAAYVAFSLSYQYVSSKRAARSGLNAGAAAQRAWFAQRPPLMLLYALLGAVGFYLFYRDVDTFLDYLLSSPDRLLLQASLAGTLDGATATFLRPFLSFAVVIGWAAWLERKARAAHWPATALVTLAAALLVTAFNLSFGLNRGSVFGPLAAILAALSTQVRRIPFWLLTLLLPFALVVAMLWGVYRANDLQADELASPDRLAAAIQLADPLKQLQLYGAAPQFLGFLLEESGMGAELYWGETLVSSLLSPVPVLGRLFRETSGPAIYNGLIYGSLPAADQIIPFQGELFLNFHLPGVLAGFALLGTLTAWLQERFNRAGDIITAYSWTLVSIWTVYLILASVSVTSQIYIYFFWPLYIYAAVSRLRPTAKARKRV